MVVPSRMHWLRDGTSVVVRSATADDGPALVRQVRAVLAEGNSFVSTLAEHRGTADDYRSYAAEYAESDRGLLLVAAAAGRLVGVLDFTAGMRVRTSHTGTFELSIAKRWRRRGVGRLLVSELLTSCATSRRIEKVCLSVLASNEPALALYRSLGFAEEGRRVAGVKLGKSRYCDEIWMYRTVTEAIDVGQARRHS